MHRETNGDPGGRRSPAAALKRLRERNLSSEAGATPNGYAAAARLFSGSPKPLHELGSVTDASGWKVAVLLSPVEGLFAGLAFGRFGLSSVATCEEDESHQAPVVGCECGFHAMYRRESAEALLGRRRGLVLLQVEQFGNIVGHRQGARSEEQDVQAVHLPGRCATRGCRRGTAGVRYHRNRWLQSCERHAGGSFVSVDSMRSALKIDVHTLD